MRKAHLERISKKQEAERIPCGENYEKMRRRTVAEFSFLSRPRQKRELLVYVDVELSGGKTGRIAVHRDDDPVVLARNFAKTFGIGAEKLRELEKALSVEKMKVC